MWTRQFGTFGNDAATDMAAGSMGIVVVGQTNQVFPGETNAGGRDVFVRFYDMTGTVMWTRQFGTAMDDSPTGVAIDSTGIYVVGNTATTFLSAFVRKYDAMGNALWATPYSSSFPPDEANDVAVTSGGVLIAGGGGFPVDAYVRKVSPTGAEVWRVQFGSTRTDRAFGVSACSAAVYVAGFTQGTLPTQTNSGGVLDAFLVQIVDATVPSNQQPVCNAGGPYIPSGRSAALDAATVSDGDGDELTYRWTSSDPNVSISPETGTIPAGFGPRTVPVAIASLTPGVGCSGSTTVTLTVDDGRCGVSTCQATVVFRDSEPPSVSCSVDLRLLDRLWPPDHDLANVGLNIVATDNCDLQGSLTTVVSVFADEEDEEPTGDGTHSPDARDVASGTMRLRAERRGDGDGRVYLIQVGVTDSSGNVGWCCCTVVVPRSNSPADVESVRVQADAARAHFEGTRLAPPGFHVVGDGPVIGPRQ
jgi:hypothetical protein